MSKRRARKERGGDGSRQRSRVRLDGLLHHHGLLDGRLAQTIAKTVTDGGEIDGFPKVGCLSGQTQMNTFSRREARHVAVRRTAVPTLRRGSTRSARHFFAEHHALCRCSSKGLVRSAERQDVLFQPRSPSPAYCDAATGVNGPNYNRDPSPVRFVDVSGGHCCCHSKPNGSVAQVHDG